MLLKASVSEMTNESSAGLTTTAATTTAAKASPLSALSGLKRPAEVVLRKPEPTLPAQATEESDSGDEVEFDPSQLPPALRLRYEHCQAYDDRKQRHHGAILLHHIDKAYEAYFDDAEWLAKEFGLLLDGGEPTALIENLHSRNTIIEIVRKGRSVAVFHGPDEVESSAVYGPETEAGHAAPYLSTDEPRPGHVPSGSDGDGSAGAGDKDADRSVPPTHSPDVGQVDAPQLIPTVAPCRPVQSRPAPGPIETLAKADDPLQLIAAAYSRTLRAKAQAEALVKEYEAAAKALDDLLSGVAIAFAETETAAEPVDVPLPETQASPALPEKCNHTFAPHTLSLPLENVLVTDLGMPAGVVSTLKAAGVLTVASLVGHRDGAGLTRIPKVGKAKAETIEETLAEFLRQRDERAQDAS